MTPYVHPAPSKDHGSPVPVPCQDKDTGLVSKHHHVAALLYFFPLKGEQFMFSHIFLKSFCVFRTR